MWLGKLCVCWAGSCISWVRGQARSQPTPSVLVGRAGTLLAASHRVWRGRELLVRLAGGACSATMDPARPALLLTPPVEDMRAAGAPAPSMLYVFMSLRWIPK